ncbi:hypothetical protein D9M71_607640 [compost metagenome]
MRARTSSLEQKDSPRLCSLIAPRGISSMKDMSSWRSMAKRTRSLISASLRPLSTTQLSLIWRKPASRAASIPAITFARSPVRVSSRKRCGSRLSRLTLSRDSPASNSGPARRVSCEPLLVMHSSRRPGRAAMRRHSSTMPLRTSGSPPVRRILRVPRATKRSASRYSSSRLRMRCRGRNCMSSAMQ